MGDHLPDLQQAERAAAENRANGVVSPGGVAAMIVADRPPAEVEAHESRTTAHLDEKSDFQRSTNTSPRGAAAAAPPPPPANHGKTSPRGTGGVVQLGRSSSISPRGKEYYRGSDPVSSIQRYYTSPRCSSSSPAPPSSRGRTSTRYSSPLRNPFGNSEVYTFGTDEQEPLPKFAHCFPSCFAAKPPLLDPGLLIDVEQMRYVQEELLGQKQRVGDGGSSSAGVIEGGNRSSASAVRRRGSWKPSLANFKESDFKKLTLGKRLDGILEAV